MSDTGSHASDDYQVRSHGLTLIIAGIFLAGEMAGTGVLALAHATVMTGPTGLFLIFFFGCNAAFVGTRLGECWIMLEERYPELRGQVRDPYPTIAEKAMGRLGRILALTCITINQYGTGCVYIVVLGGFLNNIFTEAGVDVSICIWMLVAAAGITPLNWLGTPNDFWPVAVGALVTTVGGCVLVMVREVMDVNDEESCYFTNTTGTREFEPNFPTPTAEGFFQAFGSIMFAYAGASTFPTIQSDMRDRRQFPYSAILCIVLLLFLYLPVAAIGYFTLGDSVATNVVESVCNGPTKIVIEVLLLLHLVSALPIMINPPNQFFEELLNIPKTFNWKRCAFRSAIMALLLFISETLPNFGSILNLVGGSTVTLTTFVFPPFFYMRLVKMAEQNKAWKQRTVSIYMKIYCWFVILLGIVGGGISTVFAFISIVSTNFTPPCYIEEPAAVSGH